jgi:hypothetical protein
MSHMQEPTNLAQLHPDCEYELGITDAGVAFFARASVAAAAQAQSATVQRSQAFPASLSA